MFGLGEPHTFGMRLPKNLVDKETLRLSLGLHHSSPGSVVPLAVRLGVNGLHSCLSRGGSSSHRPPLAQNACQPTASATPAPRSTAAAYSMCNTRRGCASMDLDEA